MEFKLEISSSGKAMLDYPGAELADILDRLSKEAREDGFYGDRSWTLRDSNGATVGTCVYVHEDAPEEG